MESKNYKIYLLNNEMITKNIKKNFYLYMRHKAQLCAPYIHDFREDSYMGGTRSFGPILLIFALEHTITNQISLS